MAVSDDPTGDEGGANADAQVRELNLLRKELLAKRKALGKVRELLADWTSVGCAQVDIQDVARILDEMEAD